MRELVDESQADGSPDAALESELVGAVDALRKRLSGLELQSLFSGEYDEMDAVALLDEAGDGSAHAELLVVGVGADDEEG